ncbi:DNA photolyase family protein [Demequina sp. TTPB684]|uniref:cryptochrome/photolyase family protein n=1 Tax=unclassified Demequina TaxID=2620311 RepID=UPI001CF5CE9D|nr:MULTISPECIES: deoxyribodipyrimidine photo-lyase [unclassified Demequina]MCB2413445.1 DNA photolyase family protein [Demequina sp. TTPB684]UPU88750.1 DNA photolyase family protein [Demequina sp. TMPB413]
MASLWWIRRDARLADNPALLEAQADGPAAAVFPWSPRLRLWSGRRRAYLARSLWSLRQDTYGAVAVRYGNPADVVLAAAREAGASVVWAQREHSPSGLREQDEVSRALAADDRELRLEGSPYAVAPGRVRKADGTPYQVFTPFSRAWREHGWPRPATAADARGFAHLPSDIDLDQDAALGDIQDPLGLPPPFTESAWRDRLDAFVGDALADYAEARDLPAVDATSRMSIPLAYGQIHPRTLLAAAADAGAADGSFAKGAAVFASEVAWREFHADVLFHHPQALRSALKPVIPDDAWATGQEANAAFAAWTRGETGFPLVDAGMRELAATGTMHNRVRMVVASFLIKDLHVPWQRGTEHFRRMLLDYDHAQNQLNWQWVAGTGRDAAPYFRVFNPDSQLAKFDPAGEYARRWLPDLDTPAYPSRIVDHKVEREVALADFQRGKASG